ncbi:MAG: hypothetical protein HUU38_28475 [Anaerolineales bacterium]|nr:hypothetical protein [Anaerolineales bacterium]
MSHFQPFLEKEEIRKRNFFSVSVLSDRTLTLCRRAADFAADVDADVQPLQRPLKTATGSTEAVVFRLKIAQPRPFYPFEIAVLGRAR